MAIKEFQGKYRFLSNFWPAKVFLDGFQYPTVEHAYQAAKTFDLKKREEIRNADKPGLAKRLGKKVSIRKDWEKIKISIMYNLVKQKFFNNSILKESLLSTGDEELIEGHTWNDTFWGICNGVGQNNLGKILMKIRNEIKRNQV
jgi:hypothetical protein